MSDLTAPALTEDASTSLEELFSRDPNGWTDPDLEKIVSVLRAQRTKFNLLEGVKQVEGKPRGKATALPKAKLEAPTQGQNKLSLDDLGLF